MFNSICMSAFSRSARLVTAVLLMSVVWGGDQLRLNLGAGGRPADGLIVDYKIGGTLPGVITANVVSNLGVGVPYQVTAESSGWLTVSPTTGLTPAVVAIRVNPLGMEAGTYPGSVTVHTSVLQNGKILDAWDTSSITLRIAQPAPPVTEEPIPEVAEVVNPADYGTGGRRRLAAGWRF